MENKCFLCDNKSNENYISYVRKWREYTGYSKYEYPRYLCSYECLNNYEKNNKCNYCNIVLYEGVEYIKGNDGFSYCNDYYYITIGDKTCYNYYLNKL
jgi:hypothetical protein